MHITIAAVTDNGRVLLLVVYGSIAAKTPAVSTKLFLAHDGFSETSTILHVLPPLNGGGLAEHAFAFENAIPKLYRILFVAHLTLVCDSMLGNSVDSLVDPYVLFHVAAHEHLFGRQATFVSHISAILTLQQMRGLFFALFAVQ